LVVATALQYFFKVGGQFTGELEGLTCEGVIKDQTTSVQERAANDQGHSCSAILRVADDRVTSGLQVDTNLMGPASL
jgi:hypothetical protein